MLLRRSRDSESSVLVWHDIVLVFWIYGLVVRRDVDFVTFELGGTKVFKEVGVPGAGEVDVGVLHVFRLTEC